MIEQPQMFTSDDRGAYQIAPGLTMKGLYRIVFDRVDYIRPAVETDIDALCQRVCCEIERKLGIYPNLPGREREAKPASRRRRSDRSIAMAYKKALTQLIDSLDDCRSFEVEGGAMGEGSLVQACKAIRKPIPPNLKEWFAEGRREWREAAE